MITPIMQACPPRAMLGLTLHTDNFPYGNSAGHSSLLPLKVVTCYSTGSVHTCRLCCEGFTSAVRGWFGCSDGRAVLRETRRASNERGYLDLSCSPTFGLPFFFLPIFSISVACGHSRPCGTNQQSRENGVTWLSSSGWRRHVKFT